MTSLVCRSLNHNDRPRKSVYMAFLLIVPVLVLVFAYI